LLSGVLPQNHDGFIIYQWQIMVMSRVLNYLLQTLSMVLNRFQVNEVISTISSTTTKKRGLKGTRMIVINFLNF